MGPKPISPDEVDTEEEIEILRFIHQSQKTESLQHRQNLFNAFAWWTTVLLAFVGALAALQHPLNIHEKWIIGSIISLISLLAIAFMWQQRSFSAEGIEIARKIEKRLGLFDEDQYWKCDSVLPERFACPPSRSPTTSDLIQIAVILLLTGLVWVALFVF